MVNLCRLLSDHSNHLGRQTSRPGPVQASVLVQLPGFLIKWCLGRYDRQVLGPRAGETLIKQKITYNTGVPFFSVIEGDPMSVQDVENWTHNCQDESAIKLTLKSKKPENA